MHEVNLKQQDQKSNRRPRHLIGITILIISVLFPYGWVAVVWPEFGQVMSFLLNSEAFHVLGHLSIFAFIGLIALRMIRRLGQKPIVYFGLMMGLGVVQEFLQLVSYKRRPIMANDLFDLAMDLCGTAVIFFIFKHRQSNRKQGVA